ncbi:MAG: D-proline reductase (dithiol) proprotein PrdA, partial [Tissierellia bacterium]|nr:D-proline reductase (dithiol) proprotein PrdA [Tissierellia bacterium]
MSMSQENALKYIDKDAVLCCRTEKGKVIDAGDLEDPMLFDEMVDMGLLEIPSDTLKIGNVLGATLKETSEGLTALTPALVDNIQEIKKEEDKKDLSSSEKEEVKKVKPQVSNKVQSNNLASSMVKIHIGEGKDIDLEFPLNAFSNQSNIPDYAQESPLNAVEEEIEDEKSDKKAKIKTLKREYVKVDEVKLSDETKFDGKTLYINEDSIKKAIDSENLVVDLKVDIITKDRYSEYSNTIMDVQPIAVKKEGEIGSGITRIVDGAVIVVTGTDERGVQIGEFGSSEGEMDRNMLFDRAGSPDFGDILIKINVTIKEGTNMERPGPMAAHKATDIITQEIRDQLKLLDDSY